MFNDIFLNAVNSGYFKEAANLLIEERQWLLLSVKEISQLKKYIFFRKNKLYKIPFLQKLFVNNISVGSSSTTLSKVQYTKTIHL